MSALEENLGKEMDVQHASEGQIIGNGKDVCVIRGQNKGTVNRGQEKDKLVAGKNSVDGESDMKTEKGEALEVLFRNLSEEGQEQVLDLLKATLKTGDAEDGKTVRVGDFLIHLEAGKRNTSRMVGTRTQDGYSTAELQTSIVEPILQHANQMQKAVLEEINSKNKKEIEAHYLAQGAKRIINVDTQYGLMETAGRLNSLKAYMVRAKTLKNILKETDLWRHNTLKPIFKKMYDEQNIMRERLAMKLLCKTSYTVDDLDEWLLNIGEEVIEEFVLGDLIIPEKDVFEDVYEDNYSV